MDQGLNGYQGRTPAVGLVDPKFPHSVGAAVRAASCYGIGQVWFSGDRVRLDASKRYRLPREERMRGYKDVALRKDDRFLDVFGDAVPVAVELRRECRVAHRIRAPGERVVRVRAAGRVA